MAHIFSRSSSKTEPVAKQNITIINVTIENRCIVLGQVNSVLFELRFNSTVLNMSSHDKVSFRDKVHQYLNSVKLSSNSIWAASWQNQQNNNAPSEDSDQPRHPLSMISVFPVR